VTTTQMDATAWDRLSRVGLDESDTAAEGKGLSLFVFIDALGWELVRRHGFLDDLLPTRAPLETIFGYSSTCDPTILTGVLPRDHGHFAFFAYDPARSPFRWYRAFSVLPRALTSRGRVRHWISRVMRPVHGYTGYFQLYNMPFRYLRLFDYTEKRDLYGPGGINGGQPTLFDGLRERGTPFYLSDWRANDAASLAGLDEALASRPVFAYLYLGGLDGVLHAHGTQSPEAAQKLAWYEAQLRSVLAQARRRYDETRLFVFSDHGMTDVADTCDLMARINALGLRFGVDYAAAYDSTMARFWFLQPGARERITAALDAEPRGRILSDAQLAAWGCDFPGRRYGELFYLLDPGVLLCPSFMGERPLAAMHGYAPDHKDSTAAFLASVPVDPMPRRLDGLYGLMQAEALRAEPSHAV
jgi:hypothetical protein